MCTLGCVGCLLVTVLMFAHAPNSPCAHARSGLLSRFLLRCACVQAVAFTRAFCGDGPLAKKVSQRAICLAAMAPCPHSHASARAILCLDRAPTHVLCMLSTTPFNCIFRLRSFVRVSPHLCLRADRDVQSRDESTRHWCELVL